MSSFARHLTMNNGLKMPSVGLGTFLMHGDVLKEAVDFALFVGYRHIDTALNYGNEKDIGEVLNDRIKSGRVKRKDIFVTTKVPPVYLSKESALKSAEMSLENLKMRHVDMLLIHQPWGNVNRGDGTLKPYNSNGERELYWYNLIETWRAFENIHRKNMAKSIGLSNFNPNQIQNIWDHSSIKPSNLQLEVHAYWQQTVLVNFCKQKDIVVTAYSPLGGPTKCQHSPGTKMILNDPVIKQIARENNRSPGQVLLKFLLQRNIGVLPKSRNFERIRENISLFDWTLSVNDCKKIVQLDNNMKFLTFDWAHNHPEYDKTQPF